MDQSERGGGSSSSLRCSKAEPEESVTIDGTFESVLSDIAPNNNAKCAQKDFIRDVLALFPTDLATPKQEQEQELHFILNFIYFLFSSLAEIILIGSF